MFQTWLMSTALMCEASIETLICLQPSSHIRSMYLLLCDTAFVTEIIPRLFRGNEPGDEANGEMPNVL